MAEAIFEVFRGNREGGKPVTYRVPVAPGMVVLDALHHIQAHQAPDLAVRWNCKAGKCGSCSAEVNGRPAHLQDPHGCPSPGQAHHGLSAESVPHNQRPGHGCFLELSGEPEDSAVRAPPRAEWKMYPRDLDRVQEFRKCIECFLCQNVCHVLREHEKMEEFGGPRYFVRVAALEMHPLNSKSRARVLKDELGIGLCNITKCCTEVSPEEIHITDNAIIPLKELRGRRVL